MYTGTRMHVRCARMPSFRTFVVCNIRRCGDAPMRRCARSCASTPLFHSGRDARMPSRVQSVARALLHASQRHAYVLVHGHVHVQAYRHTRIQEHTHARIRAHLPTQTLPHACRHSQDHADMYTGTRMHVRCARMPSFRTFVVWNIRRCADAAMRRCGDAPVHACMHACMREHALVPFGPRRGYAFACAGCRACATSRLATTRICACAWSCARAGIQAYTHTGTHACAQTHTGTLTHADTPACMPPFSRSC